MIEGHIRAIRDLGRFLAQNAPTANLRGRSQSRRLEGQMSGWTEGRFFTSLVLLVPPGLGQHRDVVRDVLLAITKIQYDALRGTPFAMHVLAFPGTGAPLVSERIRDWRGIGRVADLVVASAGTEPGRDIAVIENLGLHDPSGLVVVFCPSRNVEVAAHVRAGIRSASLRRIVWVLPAEAGFVSPARLTDASTQGGGP